MGCFLKNLDTITLQRSEGGGWEALVVPLLLLKQQEWSGFSCCYCGASFSSGPYRILHDLIL